jgi:hypothetical protein
MSHVSGSHNTRLANTLKKRHGEGYSLKPVVIETPLNKSALAIERFWIAVYGREDIGTGTLFNYTDGGEGTTGHKLTAAQRKHRSDMAKIANTRPEVIAKNRAANLGKKRNKPSWNAGLTMSDEQRAQIGATRRETARRKKEEHANG